RHRHDYVHTDYRNFLRYFQHGRPHRLLLPGQEMKDDPALRQQRVSLSGHGGAMDPASLCDRVHRRRHSRLAIALLRTSANRTLRLVSGTYVQLFQGTPLLMQLFLVFFGLPLAGFHIDSWFAAGVALTLHASAFLGEIWRGCINSIPSGQSEASDAL